MERAADEAEHRLCTGRMGMVWIFVLKLCTCEKKEETTKKVLRKSQTRMLVMLTKSLVRSLQCCDAGAYLHYGYRSAV